LVSDYPTFTLHCRLVIQQHPPSIMCDILSTSDSSDRPPSGRPPSDRPPSDRPPLTVHVLSTSNHLPSALYLHAFSTQPSPCSTFVVNLHTISPVVSQMEDFDFLQTRSLEHCPSDLQLHNFKAF
jgi:hypothetical protein